MNETRPDQLEVHAVEQEIGSSGSATVEIITFESAPPQTVVLEEEPFITTEATEPINPTLDLLSYLEEAA